MNVCPKQAIGIMTMASAVTSKAFHSTRLMSAFLHMPPNSARHQEQYGENGAKGHSSKKGGFKMVRSIVFFVLATAMSYGSVAAQDSGFGLGIILGEPTGLSLKQWVDGNTAIDGAIAWSFGKHDALHLHADYLVHNFTLFRMEEGKMPLYYGIGGRITFEENGNDEEAKIGVRIPIGISYILANSPLDIFLEIAPLLDLAPSTEFDLNGAIGIRYFFHKRASEARK